MAARSNNHFRRLSLETGSTEEFVPARALYAECGFTPCEPFADYATSSYNTFMTLDLHRDLHRYR